MIDHYQTNEGKKSNSHIERQTVSTDVYRDHQRKNTEISVPSPYGETGLGRKSILNTKEVRAYQSILQSESKRRHIRVKSQVLPDADGKKALETLSQKAFKENKDELSTLCRKRDKSPFSLATGRSDIRPTEKPRKIRRSTVKSININIAITNTFNAPGLAKNTN